MNKKEKETLDEMAERFTDNRELFIQNEALRIFCEAEDYAVKMETLKLLAAQR